MSSTLAVTSSQSIAWIGAQLAAAKTSQYGVVRVLASCCSVKGFAIATLLTFAGFCFYKANENRKAYKAVVVVVPPALTLEDQKVVNGKPRFDYDVDGNETPRLCTQDDIDRRQRKIQRAEARNERHAPELTTSRNYGLGYAAAGTAALVAVAVVAVFVPV